MINPRLFAIFPTTALLVLAAATLPASAKIVSEAAMVSHCAEAAATELGVMMNVKSLPTVTLISLPMMTRPEALD